MPWSETETARWGEPSTRDADTLMTDESGEYLDALTSRLPSTCTTRRSSAAISGRSTGRSTSTRCRPPPLRKVLLASSARCTRLTGSSVRDSIPASIRVMSSRLLIRSRRRSACLSMILKNWSISAASNGVDACSTVAADPLMAARGDRSSWLTIPRNSLRSLSSSSMGVMSWMTATADSISPSLE